MMPHGLEPAGSVAITFLLRASTMLTSFDGPFAE